MSQPKLTSDPTPTRDAFRWLVQFVPLKTRLETYSVLDKVARELGLNLDDFADLFADGRTSRIRYQVESSARPPNSLGLLTLMQVCRKFSISPNSLLVSFSKKPKGTYWYKPRRRFHTADLERGQVEFLSIRQVDLKIESASSSSPRPEPTSPVPGPQQATGREAAAR